MKKQFCFILVAAFLSMCALAVAEENVSCSGLVPPDIYSCCQTQSEEIYQGCMSEQNADLESICYDYATYYLQQYLFDYCTQYVADYCYTNHYSVYGWCAMFYYEPCIATYTNQLLHQIKAECIHDFTLQNQYYCNGVKSSAYTSCINNP